MPLADLKSAGDLIERPRGSYPTASRASPKAGRSSRSRSSAVGGALVMGGRTHGSAGRKRIVGEYRDAQPDLANFTKSLRKTAGFAQRNMSGTLIRTLGEH